MWSLNFLLRSSNLNVSFVFHYVLSMFFLSIVLTILSNTFFVCATNLNPTISRPVENFNIYESEWKNSAELTKEGSFRISWKPSEHRVLFLAEVRTRGYLGFGFSLDGRMVNADILVGWVNDETKKPYLVDCHGSSEAEGIPTRDIEQNVELIDGHQNDTHTILLFTRLWDTCDEDEDLSIGNYTVRLIWSMNDAADPMDDSSLYNLLWHGKERRGSKSINLRNPPHIEKPSGKETKTLDLKLSNVELPRNTVSVYWCKIFKLPTLKSKHHIIGHTPIVGIDDTDSSTEHLVRRITLYECNEKPNSFFRMNQFSYEKGFLCHAGSSKMPVDSERCTTPIITWAVGSEGEFLPKHVGLPIGGEGKQDVFYMLEVHYDNPSLKKVVDSSGIRLYYTDSLRKYDGGILVTGTAVSLLHIIPPRQLSYKTAGYCDKYCTKTVLPANGINAVSVVLHSHSASRQMKLRHFRQGEELTPIVQDEHYDFNYQQPNELIKEVTIFPEDELVTECTYNTLNRKQPTQGGYSMKQEMCLSYITYYPKVILASCQSVNPIQFFFSAFGIKKFYHYDMETIEKLFLKMNGIQQIKKLLRKNYGHDLLPKLTHIPSSMMNVFDKGLNDAHIAALKQVPDYSIDEPETETLVDETDLFQHLTISEPAEFKNKTFSKHLQDLPWAELYPNVEKTFYYGKHMTFCRLENDSLALPASVHLFPNVSLFHPRIQEANERSELCSVFRIRNNGASGSLNIEITFGTVALLYFISLFYISENFYS